MLIFNASNETQEVRAFGSYFTFKAKQIKDLRDEFAKFIAEKKAEQGLILLPEEFSDPEYKTSKEGKEKLESAEQMGIDNRVKFLRGIINNNQVSLRRDLEQANRKIDPASMATPGELEAMRLVGEYQANSEDREAKKAQEVKELMKRIGK